MLNPNATTFWIDCGAMQGEARNQLEMTDELARFFGKEARANEIVAIQLQPGVLLIRPLVYRGDDYGHYKERWRLGLPTANMGGPSYPNRVVRFDRLQIGGITAFQLTVTKPNSAAHKLWQSESKGLKGGIGTTFGGRKFGWRK
jgi:hypothetical protein